MRQPRLTGVYYHAAPTLINKQIEDAFLHKKGPGELPAIVGGKKDKAKAIIVPMYPYDLSAPCAAWAYKALAESDAPDVVIIIGQSTGEAGITTEPYETPYGIMRVDQPLARKLVERKHIKENNSLFDDNDVVESQLPFIQFVYKKQRESMKILPILVNGEVSLKELAVDIKEILMESEKKAVFIVPVNFTSYGSNYGYVPFSSDTHKKVYELDEGAIEFIKNNKPLDYLKYVDEHAMNTNNYLGIVLMMLALKPKKVFLEQYYTTRDINNDIHNFISFAALVIK